MQSLKNRTPAKAPTPTPAVPAKKTLTAAEIRKAKAKPEVAKVTPKASARPINQTTIQALKANRPNPEAAVVRKTVIKKTPVPPSEFQNKQRLAAQASRRQPAAAADSDDDFSDTPPPVRKGVPAKPQAKANNRGGGGRSGGADVKIKQSTRKVEKFDPVVTLVVRKTAAQIREEKLNQNKNTVDPDEYQLIKEERMQEMEREKKVVKAKIVESKRKQADGDEETPYEYDYEEEEMESWDSDIEVKPAKKVKELDPRKDGERVKKTMAMIRGKSTTEKIKVQDKDKEKYDVEDLSEDDNIASSRGTKNGPSKKEKMPVVQLDNLSKIINSKVSGNKRDILLVGLSESAKDAISDLLMETDIGKVGRIFDTSLEENEDKSIPKTSIAMFSEKVPILPLDERDEDSSSEDGAKARARAKTKMTAAKAADAKIKKPQGRKKVIAVGEVYEEAHFDVKKDYPSVRFIFLVKVSASDRVDVKKLHANVAYFTPIDRFKKKFMELTRAECLIIDLENRGQIYHMEFA